MGKYDPLSEYLNSLDTDHIQLTFGRIEGIIGDKLAPSARKHLAWWGNDQNSKGRQSQAWLSVGWETREPSLIREEVSFRRMR